MVAYLDWETHHAFVKAVFMAAGVPEEQIEVADICTCCNPPRLFSHRASHGLRGNLAAFLALKQ